MTGCTSRRCTIASSARCWRRPARSAPSSSSSASPPRTCTCTSIRSRRRSTALRSWPSSMRSYACRGTRRSWPICEPDLTGPPQLNEHSFSMARASTTVTPEVARGATKRERILRAAIDVFAQNGYFNAKVSDIAKAAGVADGTIYLYFDGKEDLLVNIFREHTRNYLQSLARDLAHVKRAEDRIRIAIRHHLETLGDAD